MSLTRQQVDWRALYQEGLRVKLGGELPEASTFVAPFDGEREVIVVLVPTPPGHVHRVREAMLRWAELLRGGRGLWGLITQLTGR